MRWIHSTYCQQDVETLQYHLDEVGFDENLCSVVVAVVAVAVAVEAVAVHLS